MDKHDFRFKFLIDQTQLEQIETFAEAGIRRAAKGGRVAGVLGNDKLSQSSGLNVVLPDVTVRDAVGRVTDVVTEVVDMGTDELSELTAASGGNERWIVIAIRYKQTPTDSRIDPVSGNPFDLVLLDDYDVRVIKGVEVAIGEIALGNQAPPAVGDDVIVGGIVRASGQVTITDANLLAGDLLLIEEYVVMQRGPSDIVDGSRLLEPFKTDLDGKSMQEAVKQMTDEIVDLSQLNVFLASGNLTIPSNITDIFLTLVAAGAGGGGGAAGNGTVVGGAGGGGGIGRTHKRIHLPVTPLEVLAITVGAGGLGGAAGSGGSGDPGAAGANGGDTSVAAVASTVTAEGATGGGGGTAADGVGAAGVNNGGNQPEWLSRLLVNAETTLEVQPTAGVSGVGGQTSSGGESGYSMEIPRRLGGDTPAPAGGGGTDGESSVTPGGGGAGGGGGNLAVGSPGGDGGDGFDGYVIVEF